MSTRRTDAGVGAGRGTHRQVEQTGMGWQKMERQMEQTKPMSTMVLWQKQLARRSILSCVGTERMRRIEGDGRNDICAAGISIGIGRRVE